MHASQLEGPSATLDVELRRTSFPISTQDPSTHHAADMSIQQQAATKTLIASIADEDTTTGLLLAGIGQVESDGKTKNFAIVDQKTSPSDIESHFNTFTQERKDIAILLINQHIAEKIRPLVDRYQQAFPALLEIPSKEHPYDPSKDSVLKRVQKLFGED
ncbi:V-type ATPase [Jaminaea rosea]|uniref:V-type proton ATPase subunit F n=1 Tax=Jaminaea rosea TaxID=1569628 RepID=A0A316V309_9BASI|nr:V-type ATPase [Jaminaea rosea]PWN29825.1 V-type ATPase [Jaminaea rosea]